jgi:hypothetical protein
MIIGKNSSRADVLAEVKVNGLKLAFASDLFRRDAEIAFWALKQNDTAIDAIKNPLRTDGKFLDYVKYHDSFSQEEYEKYKSSSDEIDSQIKTQQQKNTVVVDEIQIENHPAILALNPLKEKLAQETDPKKKSLAEIMIKSMESAVVSQLKDKSKNFKPFFDGAVTAASTGLNEQSSWKKVIDFVVNAILKMNFFSNVTREKPFTLFAPANRFQIEIGNARMKVEDAIIENESTLKA